MEQAGIDEVDVAAHAFAVEAAEQSRGTGSVKTLVVIENPNSQNVFLDRFEAELKNN